MADVSPLLDRLRQTLATMEDVCIGCGSCLNRCELLEGCSWNLAALCAESRAALDGASTLDDVRRAMAKHRQLYRQIRLCAGCDRCTARCPQDLSMTDLWRPWRELLRDAGFILDADAALVEVDCVWNTFSVFRHLQGVRYDDLPVLHIVPIDAAETPDDPDADIALPPSAETLFFPGCTLSAYAPELTRMALAWLEEHEGPCLLSTQCCAWPLECVGEMRRAISWRERIVAVARERGVKRIVTVCPGCEKQLAAAAATVAPDMEFFSFARLMLDAGVRVSTHAFDGCPLPMTVVDSCNDRAGKHGPAVRELLAAVESRPFPCTGIDAWCCGAGGNVASFDGRMPRQRTCRTFELGDAIGARTVVSACPTCAYTYAFERWMDARDANPHWGHMQNVNYLEVVFGRRINWPAIFDALVDMWNGEQAEWVAKRLMP